MKLTLESLGARNSLHVACVGTSRTATMMLALCAMASVAAALQAPVTPTQRCVKMHADRRALLQGSIGVASALVTPAFARTGSLMDSKKKNYGYMDEPAQAYLSEPTAEFKEAEKLRAAYREKTKEIRKVWDPEFTKFQEAKTDEDRIKQLKRLEYLILGNQGLPPGLRLTDFITLCRRVKAKATQTGGWKTDTEIAYMDMIRSIKKAENPNYKEDNFL